MESPLRRPVATFLEHELPVRITVVTPSYNQGQFLEETLRSVISQRQYIHEYFVVDGGSTDNSVELIKKYASQIDWWVSEKDSGQSDAIHRGFSRATGDYLFWLNSDDVLLSGALGRVVQALEENPTWDALTGYHIRMDEDSRVLTMHRIPRESRSRARRGEFHVCQQTCFFRRSIYERLGGLNLFLHCVMDTELWSRMFNAGAVWGHVPQYLAGFRQHRRAKGSAEAWYEKYRLEEQFMRDAYPEYCRHDLKHRFGKFAYRVRQVLAGRQLRAYAETLRFRGKPLDEVCEALHLSDK